MASGGGKLVKSLGNEGRRSLGTAVTLTLDVGGIADGDEGLLLVDGRRSKSISSTWGYVRRYNTVPNRNARRLRNDFLLWMLKVSLLSSSSGGDRGLEAWYADRKSKLDAVLLVDMLDKVECTLEVFGRSRKRLSR